MERAPFTVVREEKPKVPLLVDEPQNDCGCLEIRILETC